MASSDRRSVVLSPVRDVARKDLAVFARDALAFARSLGEGRLTRRRLRLHGLDLDLAVSDPAYAQACERVYATDPMAEAPQAGLRLTVLDGQNVPDMPRCIWTDDVIGGGPIRDALEVDNLLGLHDRELDLWQFYDPETGEGVQLMPTPETPPPWEASVPLRLFLHWAMHGIGRPLVHAGTVGLDGDCVFLAGAGGAGKSGTTLCGILDGLESVGDDYVLAELCADGVIARPLVKIMKLDRDGLRRLGVDPADPRLQGPNWQGKLEFEFERLCPGSGAQALKGQAILLPSVTGGETTRARRASAKEAMMALAPSSFAQLFGAWRADLSFLAEFCRRLPAWRVELGSDPAEVAGFLREFLGRSSP
ncbi:hypothetical protein [Breoghania sp.]|uniref:hypothetical protein n=1 Tax=Breoghania sp. TaxID=2065378 RepID=UPI002AA617C1|nr:hypothetical protein [Breoghania sp.]